MTKNNRKIVQEDCHEDSMGSGVLTLTNTRIIFDKTHGRIMDLSKKFGETVINTSLENVIKVWKEGIFMKKICVQIKINDKIMTYKFGVFNNTKWLNHLQIILENYKN